jgi:hypothetical protein
MLGDALPPYARGQLAWQVGLDLAESAPTMDPAPQRLLAEGTRLFFDLEIEKGLAMLEEALTALQTHPHRIHTDKLGRDTLSAGLLTLSRAHLEEGREGDASRVITWLMRAMPDLMASPRKHPGFLIELVESTRKRLSASRVDQPWRNVGARGACSLRIQGLDRSGANPVALTPGSHVIQVLCDGKESWVREVTLTEARLPAPISCAVHAEAAISHSEGALQWKQSVTGMERLTLTRDLADALGRSLVTVIPGQAGEDAALTRVDPDGTSTPWHPAAPAAGGGGRVWTWVSLGISAALGAGAGTVNSMHNTHIHESSFPPTSDDLGTADGLRTTSIALYGAAGVAAITAGVLFFLEGPSDSPAASNAHIPADWSNPGGAVLLGTSPLVNSP